MSETPEKSRPTYSGLWQYFWPRAFDLEVASEDGVDDDEGCGDGQDRKCEDDDHDDDDDL